MAESPTRKKATKKKTGKTKKWSKKVTETSNALDLETSVFKSNDPKKLHVL
jgi:hypothetical protein